VLGVLPGLNGIPDPSVRASVIAHYAQKGMKYLLQRLVALVPPCQLHSQVSRNTYFCFCDSHNNRERLGEAERDRAERLVEVVRRETLSNVNTKQDIR
jgi:hypothetical protein